MSPFLSRHFSHGWFPALLRYREPLSLLRASSGLGEHGTVGTVGGFHSHPMCHGEW